MQKSFSRRTGDGLLKLKSTRATGLRLAPYSIGFYTTRSVSFLFFFKEGRSFIAQENPER